MMMMIIIIIIVIVIIMSTFVKRKINGPQMRYALFKFLVFH